MNLKGLELGNVSLGVFVRFDENVSQGEATTCPVVSGCAR